MNPDSHDLIQRHMAGLLTEDEAAVLQTRLKADTDLRRLYLHYMNLDVALEAQAGSRERVIDLLRTAPMAENKTAGRWLSWRPLATAAAVLVLAGISFWLRDPLRPALGTITQVLDAELSSDDTPPYVGQRIDAGRRVLARGAVEVTLSNGVTILYEGPGEFELLSPMRAVLHSGRVVVRVPPNAIGFQMDCATVQVVDLGTEFALKTGPGQEADVQVFEGEVVATLANGGFPRRMTTGQAVRFSTADKSEPEPLQFSDTRFLRHLPLDTGIPLPPRGRALELRAAHHAELIIPAAANIRVDGDLSEWSDEGSFKSEWDAERSVEGRMRHDASGIFIAAHIRDPYPLRNVIDPEMDGDVGWRGGGLQVRLALDREQGWPANANAPGYYRTRKLMPDAAEVSRAAEGHFTHLTFWHHAPSGRDCLHVAYGLDYHGGTVNPPGYEVVFKADADGKGYTIEGRVPWSLLNAAEDPPQAGDVLAVCWSTHWSDETGRLQKANLVELRNPDEPMPIYDWERAATWGRARYR